MAMLIIIIPISTCYFYREEFISYNTLYYYLKVYKTIKLRVIINKILITPVGN